MKIGSYDITVVVENLDGRDEIILLSAETLNWVAVENPHLDFVGEGLPPCSGPQGGLRVWGNFLSGYGPISMSNRRAQY
jgi:hypothetical protein